MHRPSLPLAALTLTLSTFACQSDKTTEAAASPAQPVASAPTAAAPAAPAAAPAAPAADATKARPNSLPPIKPVGEIENYRRLSQKIAQGGGPETKADFEALAAEGMKTLISVDGAEPHVEVAKALGMSYVHVPIGYDGLTPEEQARIVKAVTEAKGPIFIHCHHGLHRGPAAAAVARMVVDGIDHDAASLQLKDSGCSPNYPGLYRDVAEFEAPSKETLAAIGPLPAAVKPSGVRDAMVHIDEHFDYLKASQAAKWKVSPQYPDVSPPHEAKMLVEAFAEMQRLDDAKKLGPEFLKLTKDSEAGAATIRAALDAGDVEKAEAAWAGFKKSCENCHKTYRN